jgi:mono/diheme cytochrome c family protein
MTRSLTSAARSAALVCLLTASVSVAYAADSAGRNAASTGEVVYERWCAPCHAAGPGHPGTQSLEQRYGGKVPAVLLERNDLSAEAVKVFVRQGVLMMAPFRKTEITDAELDALAAYVARNYKAP